MRNRISRCIVVSLLALFSITDVAGQGYFELTPEVVSAYESVSRLRLEEAKVKIAAVKKSDPNNLLIYLVENYIDFFTLFINEEEEVYNRIKDNKDIRLDKIKEGDQSSPYYLFCIAEINLQWATARLKFGEKLKPLREVYSAYKLLEENEAKFPDFIANKKSLSIIHALGESIPGLVRTLFSVEGSIEKGTREIASLAAYSDKHPEFIFREETYAIYAYILFYQNNQKEKAYEVLKRANLEVHKSPLLCFLMANITHKNGHSQEAMTILEQRPKGPEYLPFYYLDFMYGKYLMYNLDATALRHMEKFTNNFQGRHFIKEAYQKLGWFALATADDVVAYKKYMALCSTNGYKLVDEDKQAAKEAESQAVPNAILLRARMLCDGGYYAKAYQGLVLKAHLFTKAGDERIEFHYRMGRITQELGNLTDAINYYLQTIDQGEETDGYYACSAALQTGLILEGQKEYTKALQLFERCLALEPSEYKASLHQKAKSGIERVNEAVKQQ